MMRSSVSLLRPSLVSQCVRMAFGQSFLPALMTVSRIDSGVAIVVQRRPIADPATVLVEGGNNAFPPLLRAD